MEKMSMTLMASWFFEKCGNNQIVLLDPKSDYNKKSVNKKFLFDQSDFVRTVGERKFR